MFVVGGAGQIPGVRICWQSLKDIVAIHLADVLYLLLRRKRISEPDGRCSAVAVVLALRLTVGCNETWFEQSWFQRPSEF